jgi:tetratricopeptide (TPR) repeat protein
MLLKFIKYLTVFVFAFMFSNSQAFAISSEIVAKDCYVIKMAGTKVGYSCQIQRKKTENGSKYIVTDSHYELKIKRIDKTIGVVQDINYVEQEDSGVPVSFLIESSGSNEKFKISGKFKTPLEIAVNSEVNGVKSTKAVKYKEKILFPYAVQRLYSYNNNKIVAYNTLEPGLDLRSIKIKAEKQNPENLAADGFDKNFTKYKVSVSVLPGTSNFEWRDLSGKLIKEYTSLLKLENVIVKDKNEIANITGEANFDLMGASIVSVDKPVPDPDSFSNLSYKIKTFNSPSANLFLQDDRQRITLIKNDAIYMSVNAVKPESAPAYSYPFDTKGLEEYLQSGPFIMPDSDKISAAAKTVSSGETDAYVIAKKMENWVYNYITNKNYSVDFASAIDTMESRTGDCTEHAVLLASLLRAAGIPSKIVVGLIYTDNPKPCFGYHMWVKAYIAPKSDSQPNPKWIDLDATLPYKNFVPTHITMAETPLNNLSDRADALIKVLQSFSNIKIEVLIADKTAVTKLNNGIIKINIKNATPEDFITIKTVNNKLTALNSDNSNMKIISFTAPNDSDYVRSAFYSFIKGNIKESLTDFQAYYNSIPADDDFSYMKLGLKLTSLGFFNMAQACFDKVNDKDIWAVQIANTKYLYFPKKSFSVQEEAIINNAISKINFQNLPEEGIELINKNKGKFSNNDYARYLLAKAYLNSNSPVLAQTELKKAIKLYPENLTYRMTQSKIYERRSSYKSAERELELIKELADKSNIEDISFRQELDEQQYWLKFKLERSNPIKSKFFKAKYYEAKGEYNVALDLLQSITVNNSDKVAVYEAMGQIYTKINQPDDARKYFQWVLELQGKNLSALTGLGKIAFSQKNYKEALDKYTKAIVLEPNNTDLKLKVAEIYELLGQEEKAGSYYKDILQVSSFNAEANYKLGMMYVRTGDINEASKALKRAIASNPMFSPFWLDLAGLEITKGNYDLALAYLKPVIYSNDSNPYYYYYLGLIKKAQGDYDGARQHFDKAIELKPDFDEVNQEIDKL